VVERLAERAVNVKEKFPYHLYFAWAKGLADYRAGRPAEAIKRLESFAPKDDGTSLDAAVFAALAMAKHGVGDAEEAKASLAKARAIVAGKMPVPAKGQPIGQNRQQFEKNHFRLTCFVRRCRLKS
jgi:hypothetical protein